MRYLVFISDYSSSSGSFLAVDPMCFDNIELLAEKGGLDGWGGALI